MARRFRINPLSILLIVVAVAFLVVGIIYLTQTTNHLPSFIPGKPSAKLLKRPICNAGKTNKPCFTPRHYTKRGIAGIGVGVVALVAAFYLSGLRNSGSAPAADATPDASGESGASVSAPGRSSRTGPIVALTLIASGPQGSMRSVSCWALHSIGSSA